MGGGWLNYGQNGCAKKEMRDFQLQIIMAPDSKSLQYQSFPQFLQVYQLYRRYKMASKTGGQSKIIIPALLNHFQFHPPRQDDRDIHQQEKPAVDSKIYLAPKHDSLPIALTLARNQNSLHSALKFTPTFQNFELCHLFSKKLLNEKQAAAFSKLQQEANQNYLSPIRQSKVDPSWSSFKMVDPHLTCTADSQKNQRSLQAQPKKSRPKQKGLRKLSQRAYEIVMKMRSASYKEVANKLVDQLNSQQQLDHEGKDQQNIKRRVYDALNVLIALGVLRKEGRKIVADREKEINFQQQQAAQLSKRIETKQQQLFLKKQKLNALQDKIAIYSSLTQRDQKAQSQIVEFPFLTICSENPTQMTVAKEERGVVNKLNFGWSKGPKDYCLFDIDLLVNYHKKVQSKQQL